MYKKSFHMNVHFTGQSVLVYTWNQCSIHIGSFLFFLPQFDTFLKYCVLLFWTEMLNIKLYHKAGYSVFDWMCLH